MTAVRDQNNVVFRVLMSVYKLDWVKEVWKRFDDNELEHEYQIRHVWFVIINILCWMQVGQGQKALGFRHRQRHLKLI